MPWKGNELLFSQDLKALGSSGVGYTVCCKLSAISQPTGCHGCPGALAWAGWSPGSGSAEMSSHFWSLDKINFCS